MSVALDFGAHPDVVFGRAPLLNVLCQVKFTPILSLLTQAGVTGFQEALRHRYPKFLEPTQQASVAMGPNGVGVQTAPPVWRLSDNEGRWTVGLAADFVSLETEEYSHIDDFAERFGQILGVVDRVIRPSESVRIGLRKVNAFELPVHRRTESLRGVVRAEMLGPLAVEAFPVPITTFASQLAFTEYEFNRLVVRYGLQPVSPDEDGLRYVLDIDYFTEEPYQIDGRDEFLGLIKHFSAGITNFFHWAIEPDYLDTLEPRPRREGDQGQ